MKRLFQKFAAKANGWFGSPLAFVISCLMVISWLVLGPAMHYSDTWQLLINTPTTVLTFLLAVLIAATQNTNDKAIHVKLDSIIAALDDIPNKLQGIEDRTEEELSNLKSEVDKP